MNEGSIEDCITAVESEIGPIEVVVFNLGAQVGNRSLQDTSDKVLELGWRMSTFALFRTAPTAAVRGNAQQHCHAAAMGGQRRLCQSLNAEYVSKGIHVAYVVIDGSVDAPDTLGEILGAKKFQQLREEKGMGHDGLMLPEKIAETYLHLHQQNRSDWTHELDLRAYSDPAWWNH